MALFQKAPSTPDDMEASRPLEIEPGVVANMDEDEWYAKAYRGDSVPQLTVRAVVMGSILGFVLAFTNLYIGLKTGWHLGVAITACILSFSIWRMLLSAKLVKTQMTILENNCMQSTASAAGYSTGGTFVSAIAALLMMSATPDNDMLGEHLPWHVLVLWTFFLAVLGVTLAIPMKRNMINQEKLKFPSGLAAASTLQSLYADAAEATRKAKVLAYAAIFGAIWPPLIDLKVRVVDGARTTLVTGQQKLFDFLPGAGMNRDTGDVFKPSDWTIKWDMNPVMIGAGMLVGLRVSLSMLAAAIALAYVIGPAAYEIAWTGPDGDTLYAVSSPGRAWREIGLGLVLPFQYPLSMLIGAVAAHVWTKRSPKSAGLYVVPIAAGLIAGISIMGVIVALMNPVFFE